MVASRARPRWQESAWPGARNRAAGHRVLVAALAGAQAGAQAGGQVVGAAALALAPIPGEEARKAAAELEVSLMVGRRMSASRTGCVASEG